MSGSPWRTGGKPGARRRRCWRRSGSTRIRRSATRTTSRSSDGRCRSPARSIPRTASLARRFGCSPRTIARQIDEAGRAGLNPLIAGYGPALLDRAVLDALCRLHGVSFYAAMQTNLPGLTPVDLLPEFAGFDFDRFLAGLRPAAQPARPPHRGAGRSDHRGGPADGRARRRWTARDPRGGRGPLRPHVLQAQGRRRRDGRRRPPGVDRSVLDRRPTPYVVSLDGNEQYETVDGVLALWRALTAAPKLARLVASILFLEQPITRTNALRQDVTALSAARPVIIDESDADLDAFPQARARGYRGVSSKSCKGVYKSLLNLARCAQWNRQAGDDAVLHVRRGSHHPGGPGRAAGPGARRAPRPRSRRAQRTSLRPGPGRATARPSRPRSWPPIRISTSATAISSGCASTAGRLAIGSLACPGFATAAEPDWASLRPIDNS